MNCRPLFFVFWLSLLGVSFGAEIEWETPADISGQLSDFDTVGTPVFQWNGGTNAVTVEPGGMNLVFETTNKLATNVSNMDPHDRGGDQTYEALLGTMSYSGTTATIVLPGLTVGHRYRVQIWLADTRNCCSQRLKTYDSGVGSDEVILLSGPPSQYVIGTFTADATTQDLRCVGNGATHPQYNAIALRTTGAPTPEVDVYEVESGIFVSEKAVNVASGVGVTLRWDVDDADSVMIDHGVGIVATEGSVVVNPTMTTTYRISSMNVHGTTTQDITVYVDAVVVAPRLNELVAKNGDGLKDEDGEEQDWLELYNPNPFPIDAGLYRLTDDGTLAVSWEIPAGRVIDGEGFLVIFGSDKNRVGAELHTDFKFSSEGDYIALLDDSGTTILGQIPLDYPTTALFPEVPEDRSYGYDESGMLKFFDKPSPGEVNGAGFDGFVADTGFSHDRGFYDTEFSLLISSETPEAVIRYTTDGSLPSATNGMTYSGPLSISQTTAVRAMATKPGFAPTNVDTHTYIFASDVIASSVMDTGITQNAAYSEEMVNSLKALPVISINVENVGDLDNDSEQLTSVEMIFADGKQGFQEDAGISLFGGYYTDFAKKSYRLYFRKRYGVGKLEYPLYRGFENGYASVEKFDSLELRSGSHDMAMRGAYMGNRFSDDTMLEMGNVNPHGRFVHVIRNGVYWGQYHLRERWNAAMAEEYFGGEKEDYEAINGNANVGGWAPGTAYDGDGSGWAEIKARAAGSTPWTSLLSRVDMRSYLDFMLMYKWGSSENEYRAFLESKDFGLGMRIYLNDADGYFNPSGIAQNNDAGGPGNLLGRLKIEGDPDFKVFLADRIYEHYFNGGAFTVEKTVDRLQRRVDEVQLAFYCEAARWGYRTPASWQSYQDNLLSSQLLTQRDTRLAELRNEGLYPSVEAPEFSQHGGVVSAGYGLYVSSASGGTVYLTTDGSDPRLSGGAIYSGSQVFSGTTSGGVSLISEGSEWRYLDNGSNAGTAWKETGFNDSGWASGNGELGYGDGGEATVVSYGSNESAKHVTTYFRRLFEVSGATGLTSLNLDLKRDDGARVFLNGVEVVRSNLPTGNINFNTFASAAIGGGDESAFTQFSVDAGLLLEGTNVIAVEVHQASAGSSDVSFDLRLFASGSVGPADLNLSEDTVVKARVLKNGEWSALHEAEFIISVTPVAPVLGDLVISELHYHPKNPTAAEEAADATISGDDDFEFLEIMNVSELPVRLDGARFDEGIHFVFGEDSVLRSGERLVIVSNLSAFGLRHSLSVVERVVGEYAGQLKNSGERILLVDSGGGTLVDFTYEDGSDLGEEDWPNEADGDGESLVLIHPQGGGDLSSPFLWRKSFSDDGSPGGSDAATMPMAPLGDLDGDGFANLLESVLMSGGAGEVPRVIFEVEDFGGDAYLVVRFVRNTRYEAGLKVEVGDVNLGWSDGGVLLGRVVHGDGTETLRYRYPVSVAAGDGRQFMRLRLE